MSKKLKAAKTNSYLEEAKGIHAQPPLKDADYYCITFLGDESGKIQHSVQSIFAGFTDTKPPREIREASFVHADKMRTVFNEIKELSFIVNDKKDLYVFLLLGGHGIIERSLAEDFFSDLLKPKTVVYSFSKGFLHADTLPKHKTNHAPTPKVRMNVLKRDNFRCRICGRSPDDNVDIELHVHHIIPWGGRYSGVTEEDNLITLCQTCHNGLEPHYEPRLFSKLKINPLQDVLNDRNRHQKGMKLYQEIAKKAYKK